MGIFSRYLLRHFFNMFVLIMPGLTGTYLLVEIAERLNNIIEAGVPFKTGALYFLLITPKTIFELAPVAAMMSGLLAVMLLARRNEIIAMRSIGISVLKIIRCFLFFAAVVSFAMLVAQTIFIPKMTRSADVLWQTKVKKEPLKGMLKENRLFYRSGRTIWTAELLDSNAKTLKDVYIINFDDKYGLVRLIGAEKARYSKGIWTFSNGFIKTRTQGRSDGNISVQIFSSKEMKFEEGPEEFTAIQTPPSKVDILSLFKNILRLKASGYPADEQETAFWAQILYPFLGVTLLWLGMTILFRQGKGSMAVGLGLGLTLSFAALVSWDFFITLAKTSVMPPLLAALMTHIVFAGAGYVVFKKSYV
ncbi:LptF/LptG family permease [Dissulfurimicrobium hydrothermale]|uniref:LptF/LptG family permease n=1 Tax=Dissulfurimicrobium hydrothermale TaxID=1750598 RepID=UPI001EDB47C8|nr:LptF/LptG family permease [Dissulfurimicrobium hydrothermale]UKL14238.1 LptF/LptG family permease [Dissulfurimicrobium hydrothermale]